MHGISAMSCALWLQTICFLDMCVCDHLLPDRSSNTRSFKIPTVNAWLNNKEGEMIFPPKWLLIQAAVSSFTQCTVICLPSHLGKGHAAMVFTYVCVYSQPEVARRCSCNGERKENSEKKNVRKMSMTFYWQQINLTHHEEVKKKSKEVNLLKPDFFHKN